MQKIKAIPLQKLKNIMENPHEPKNKGLFWSYDDTFGVKRYYAVINTQGNVFIETFSSKQACEMFLNDRWQL